MGNENDITKKDTKGGKVPQHLIQFLIQKSLGDDPLPRHWYQERRKAEGRFHELSGGGLVLLSRVYSGDDERHQLVHEKCGRPFLASLDEVRAVGAPTICPHCNLTDDLSRFGGIEQVQHYVIQASRSAAYFYAANILGSPAERYSFLCTLHKRPFRATFTEFQETRGETNGCPLCRSGSPAILY